MAGPVGYGSIAGPVRVRTANATSEMEKICGGMLDLSPTLEYRFSCWSLYRSLTHLYGLTVAGVD